MSLRPVIGIVGSGGAFGRWLRGFFESRMGLQVIGHDPVDAGSQTPEQLLEQADVLLFSAPIRHTPALIRDYIRQSAGRERGKLWLDVTSIKRAPVEAMLASRADVVGLHPMTAPPKAPTLKGRVMVVCEARVDRWRAWLQHGQRAGATLASRAASAATPSTTPLVAHSNGNTVSPYKLNTM